MSLKEGMEKYAEDTAGRENEAAYAIEDFGNLEKYQNEEYSDGTKRRVALTEKGKEYQLEILLVKRKKLHSRMGRKFKLIDSLLYSSRNLTTVKEELEQLNNQFKELISVHQDYMQVIPQELVTQEEEWFESFDEMVFTQKHKYYNWIKEGEDESQLQKSNKASSKKLSSKGSSKSMSSRSAISKTSVKERALEEKLKMAELEAEVSFFEEKQAAIFNAERLRQTEELAKLKARSEVYQQIQELDEIKSHIDDSEQREIGVKKRLVKSDTAVKHSDHGNEKLIGLKQAIHSRYERDISLSKKPTINKGMGKLDPGAGKFEPFNRNKDELHKVLMTMIQQQAAPDVELESFDGNPLEYHHFMDLFTEVVEKWVPDQKGRLLRLLKYTKGEAHNLIKHCIQEPAYVGYTNAQGLLRKRYGDPHIIMSSYRKEVRCWPKLKFGDAKGFREFYNFLVKCDGVAKEQNWNAINTPDIICLLVSKLPNGLIDRWNRTALNIRKKQNCEPTLNDLIDFVDQETTLVNDPMFSREALKIYGVKAEDNYDKRPRKIKSLAIETQEEECPFCSGKHTIESCDNIKKVSVKERSKFFFKKRLCYGCCRSISDGHNAKTCKNRRKCDICNKAHPTLLHGLPPKNRDDPVTTKPDGDKNEIKSNSTVMNCASSKLKQVISMCVVPVKVRFNGSKLVVKTWAMLDNCSQGSFVKSTLLDEMKIKGTSTSFSVKTLNGECKYSSVAVDGLEVANIDGKQPNWIKLPRVFSQDDLPVTSEEIATAENIQQWEYLHQIIPEMKANQDLDVKLLIGANCMKAIEPLEVISSQNEGPYAFKTRLGWCVVGPISENDSQNQLYCNRITLKDESTGKISRHHYGFVNNIKEEGIGDLLKKMYDADFTESNVLPLNGINEKLNEISEEDIKFLRLMDEKCTMSNGHYVLPLPFKKQDVNLPNNKWLADRRLHHLKRKLEKDERFYQHYKTFMDNLLLKGYAKESKTEEKALDTWFVPHHGVYHPHKPDKIRVVFDCSCAYQGRSLNKELLSGPDLTNQIIGILSRFREHEVAMMADIEAMFYQVMVSEEHRSFLKFLWWKDGNLNNPIVEYNMNVHVFGATSSPGCSNYALKRTSVDFQEIYGYEASETLRRNFYVDDLLKSVKTEKEAINLVKNVKLMCRSGGFNLTKFLSNSKKLLETIPTDDRRKGIVEGNLTNLALPTETALGVLWNAQEDMFTFKINLKENASTRRGMLSTLSSIYDPLGFVAPFILKGKIILQHLCQENIKWDDPVPEHTQSNWEQWLNSIRQLSTIKIDRCFIAKNSKNIKHCSLHHFSDASEEGYGQVTYIRTEDENNLINCNIVIAKSRVTPVKFVSIPRLELTAATLSVKIATQLRQELDIQVDKECFWTDSKVVLGYIQNTKKRFKTFVANRIHQIKSNSDVNQWYYVKTDENPADICSRGLEMKWKKKVARWFQGPNFLWKPISFWTNDTEEYQVDVSDEELKAMKVHMIQINDTILSNLETRISSWGRMRRVMGYVLLFINKTRSKCIVEDELTSNEDTLSVANLKEAEEVIIKLVQKREFGSDIQVITQNELNNKQHGLSLKNKSLQELKPFADNIGLIRVGGRLERSSLEFEARHPVILPKTSIISRLIVTNFHNRIGHGGRSATMQDIRNAGYWIINCNALVRHIIYHCVHCRSLRGKFGTQVMASLPKDRVTEAPPFTYCGVDIFGPFLVKERRSELKRYGALFTCLASRGVHIEVVASMETDSFIMALRRFIARRGNIRTIRSDNGSNFIGAENELKRAIEEMDHSKIKYFLQTNGTDWLPWIKNTPTASHMGGVWERQIRSARNILTALLKTHSRSLNDEGLSTLMTEVEAILNSRPLTVELLSDGNSMNPISPSNLLTMKSKIIMPPPGRFEQPDIYSRKRWRRVQHIAEEFWCRWRKEFLVTLQQRQKWSIKRRNYKVDDIVLLRDDSHHRNHWPMARVVEIFEDVNGDVRNVKLKLGNVSNNERTLLERPISKIVLLLESNKEG